MAHTTAAWPVRRRPARRQIRVAPAGLRSAAFASPRARALALGLDVAIYVLLSPITLGTAAVLLRSFWWAGAIGGALAYLAVSWSSGASVGMQAAGIRAIEWRTGRPPGLMRATLRAMLSLPPCIALFVLADALLASDPRPLSAEPLVTIPCVVLVVAGALNELWTLVDPRCQGLSDRLTGIALVESPRPERALSSWR